MTEFSNVFAGLEAGERGRRALDRLKEIFKVEQLPPGLELLAGSENGINDVYMNLNRQLSDGKLTRESKLLIAAGLSSALGSPGATRFFAQAAVSEGRTSEEVLEAIAVATVAAAFNGYYRFRYQLPPDLKDKYASFKAAFNANTFLKTSLKKEEMELICVAVSSANNCMGCVDGHVNAAKNAGATDEQIDEVIRVSAIVGAVARTLAALDPLQSAGAGKAA